MNIPTTVDQLAVTNARLPAAYEAARTALATCATIDECQDWANKASALASYARQANDDTLQKHATRIQSRAVRRCGELLKDYAAPGARVDLASKPDEPMQPREGALPRFATEAARQAGMSAHQQKQAMRVASLPEAFFEAAVESEEPPTLTALADMGRKPSRADDTPPPGFAAAIQLMGFVRRLAEFAGAHEADFIAGGVTTYQRAELRGHVAKCRRFLDAFAPKLREG